jgi:hypothetical protein
MTFARKKKQVATLVDPLTDAGILQQVFTFLPGHWLFLGAVCREWQAVYAGIAEQSMHSLRLDRNPRLVTCDTRTTIYSAAVASPARVRLACECGLPMNYWLHVMASLCADVQTLATLRQLGMPLSDCVVTGAALSGRLSFLQHLSSLTDERCPRRTELSYYAALSGNISMLDWLRAQSWCLFDDTACSGAAKRGHLTALKHLRNEGCDWDVERIAKSAASSGSIETLEWLRQQQGVVIDATTLAAAAGAGQIGMCRHLRNTGCDWNDDACIYAAYDGHLSTLRWMRENECPCDMSGVFTAAARYGFTNILGYVIEQGEVLDAELLTDALNVAGAFDQLQAAQWLRQRGAEWPAVLGYDDTLDDNEPFMEEWSDDTLAWARAEE